jgi:hypothetical protein
LELNGVMELMLLNGTFSKQTDIRAEIFLVHLQGETWVKPVHLE